MGGALRLGLILSLLTCHKTGKSALSLDMMNLFGKT